jgi:hypothetical protein
LQSLNFSLMTLLRLLASLSGDSVTGRLCCFFARDFQLSPLPRQLFGRLAQLAGLEPQAGLVLSQPVNFGFCLLARNMFRCQSFCFFGSAG